MTYELAKQLKDAGFPLRSSYGADLDMFSDELSIKIDGDTYMKPTLSELIEACGNNFHKLTNKAFNKGTFVGELWEVQGWLPNSDSSKALGSCDGQTPEEAVAKLWLELNK